ncbi:MAG: glycosyltransferase family 2 protein, partial [Oscillospiraceae bacterium]
MEAIRVFNYVIAIVFFICYFYQLCYIPISLIKKSRTYTKKINHRFAVLICARNEETVIGQLIESVLAQNYPAELIDIYVAADNCTDSTAEVARKAGANVYERFDKTNVGKGYALNFLIENIVSQHTWDKYDGYFVFDADNLLDENYISEMNKAFSSGNNVV